MAATIGATIAAFAVSYAMYPTCRLRLAMYRGCKAMNTDYLGGMRSATKILYPAIQLATNKAKERSWLPTWLVPPSYLARACSIYLEAMGFGGGDGSPEGHDAHQQEKEFTRILKIGQTACDDWGPITKKGRGRKCSTKLHLASLSAEYDWYHGTNHQRNANNIEHLLDLMDSPGVSRPASLTVMTTLGRLAAWPNSTATKIAEVQVTAKQREELPKQQGPYSRHLAFALAPFALFERLMSPTSPIHDLVQQPSALFIADTASLAEMALQIAEMAVENPAFAEKLRKQWRFHYDVLPETDYETVLDSVAVLAWIANDYFVKDATRHKMFWLRRQPQRADSLHSLHRKVLSQMKPAAEYLVQVS